MTIFIDACRQAGIRFACWRMLWVAISVSAAAGPARADDSAAASEAFFESRIRPLLAEHCFACHSGRAERVRGGLRLDHAEHVMRGGVTGAAIVPGQPDESLLIRAVRYDGLEMPPNGQLSKREVNLLVRWVRLGAHYPRSGDAAGTASEAEVDRRASFQVTAGDRAHWAYQPIRRPRMPLHGDAGGFANPVDGFVFGRLERLGLRPNPPAEPQELVRRLAFVITGLPPQLATVKSFVSEPTDEQWSRLVDDMLARPAYGERWGRHWLDLVRFAQTNGYERDGEKPYAWRYRDFVIQSLNADKPFDRFVVEQLAGDQLADGDHDTLIATGFYRLGVWNDEPDDGMAAEFDALDDILSTLGQVFLGQTLGCARCHDHMVDPISQRDYYRLLAFLRNIRPYEKPRFHLDSATFAPLADAKLIASWRSRQAARIAAVERQLADLPADDGAGRHELQQRLASLQKEAPDVDWALAVRQRSESLLPTHVLIRGNPRTPGEQVESGFPEVFEELAGEPRWAASGSRLEFAQWIASSANPLTARVIANRIWQHHFGRGLVATPNDFGRGGQPPTHPELLDWLAAELIESGWSLKHLHRLILQSNTWRMSSRTTNELAQQADPDNWLFWRQHARRLEAEAIRDSVLSAAGQLNLAAGGRGFFPRLEGEVVAGQSKPGFGWESSARSERSRRSVYGFLKRGLRDPFMEAFDYGNTDAPLGKRPTTTVAPQSMILLNSRFMLDQARALAHRVAVAAGDEPATQVRVLFERLFARQPSNRESSLALEYLANQERAFAQIAGELTFRPDVPASLYSEYRRRLTPDRYLLGPRDGWSYHAGRWSAGYEAIETVDRPYGPFSLLTATHFREGTVSGRLRLGRSTELATLLVRARATADSWHGVAFTLDPLHGKIVATVVTADATWRREAPWRPIAGRWMPLRIDSSANRVRLVIGRAAPIEVDTPAALVGQFGVAAWGGPLTLADLRLETAGPSTAPLPPGWRRACGEWTAGADGVLRAVPRSTAQLIRTIDRLDSGNVEVDIRLSPGKVSTASLLLRIADEPRAGVTPAGYEVRLDASNRRVVLGSHRNGWHELQSASARLHAGRWHRVHVALNGPLISVRLDGSAEALIVHNEQQPFRAGLIGFQATGSPAAFRNLALSTGQEATRENLRPPANVSPRQGELPDRQALIALCQVLMNLNEFVYVD